MQPRKVFICFSNGILLDTQECHLECDRLSGELNVLQADKQRLEATCDALRKQRASPPMTEVQKSLLSWVDDTRHTLKSANASNDDLPLLVSVMEGSLDRQAERIHALLSRSGSEAFESTIQHDTTVASDQVLDTSNGKVFLDSQNWTRQAHLRTRQGGQGTERKD